MNGSTSYDGACECGGLIENTPEELKELKLKEQKENEWPDYAPGITDYIVGHKSMKSNNRKL